MAGFPALCFCTRRSQLSKTETFCGNSSVQPTPPMASQKGRSAHLSQRPHTAGQVVLWHCRNKIAHQVWKESLATNSQPFASNTSLQVCCVHPDKPHNQMASGMLIWGSTQTSWDTVKRKAKRRYSFLIMDHDPPDKGNGR